MPYFDEDLLYNELDSRYKVAKGEARETYSTVLNILFEMPRADLVPKSEVERWRRNLEAVLEERAEEKTEVAREIFAEIDRTFKALLVGDISDIEKVLAELKKKYTEGET